MTETVPPPSLATFLTEEQILQRYAGADDTTLERFWAEVRIRGTPLRDPHSHRVTFLWRGSAESERVHLHINRVTDKQRQSAGYMTRVPGTDIWARTLEIAPTLRASYGFHLHPAAGSPLQGPPPHDRYPALLDPFNPVPPMIRDGERGLSVLRGPLSPVQPEWEEDRSDAAPRGTLLSTGLRLPTGTRPIPQRRCHLHLPPDTGEPVPLLVIFDAETWFGRLGLPQAVEQAVVAARIPPLVVLGIENIDRGDRVSVLGANPVFLRAVAGTAVPWAEKQAAEHGLRLAEPGQRILAGQSLGGLSALFAAHVIPESFGRLICQSPSLWWTSDGRATPRDLGGRSADWITEVFASEPPGGARVYLDVGTREAHTLPRTHQLDQTLRQRGWPSQVNVYDGGHDFAWWRGALIDRLAEIFSLQ